MVNRPIDYIFLEGPDLSGKTTFYQNLHKETDYCWNIQDRSALSMLVHARYYGRDQFNHIEQLKREIYNLNNVIIILLPSWEEIARRFNIRGDDIQNLVSLKKIYELFEEAAAELYPYPNVWVVRGNTDLHLTKHIASTLRAYELSGTVDVQLNCLTACAAANNKEIVGLNFTLYDSGDFADIDEGDLLYDKEVDYYDSILSDIREKINKELSGENEYERKETVESRRFIYTSDTCISLAHFLLRDEFLDCKFFLRSSNVKDTLYYDINFLKRMASEVYQTLNVSREKFCRMNFTINSGHIILEDA